MPVNSRKHRLEPESRGCGAESAMSEKKSSIRDVAQLAGVSISTVSRVLNDPERAKSIPPEMRERVRQAVEALRYVPNFNARRVFMHRAEEIGLLIPSSRNLGMPIFEDRHLAKLVSGIEAGLEESNYRLLLIFNDERFVERREYLSLIQSQHVDGLIVWGAQSTEEYWRRSRPGCRWCSPARSPEKRTHSTMWSTRPGRAWNRCFPCFTGMATGISCSCRNGSS